MMSIKTDYNDIVIEFQKENIVCRLIYEPQWIITVEPPNIRSLVL